MTALVNCDATSLSNENFRCSISITSCSSCTVLTPPVTRQSESTILQKYCHVNTQNTLDIFTYACDSSVFGATSCNITYEKASYVEGWDGVSNGHNIVLLTLKLYRCTCEFMAFVPWLCDLRWPLTDSNWKHEYAQRGPQLVTHSGKCFNMCTFMVHPLSPVVYTYFDKPAFTVSVLYTAYHRELQTSHKTS